MSCSSSLTDIADPLVLDTSVLINLHACTYGERILMAIPNDILVPEIVAGELEHQTSRKNGEYGFLRALVASEFVTLTKLTDVEYEVFVITYPQLLGADFAVYAGLKPGC
jgi:hypothetical protein